MYEIIGFQVPGGRLLVGRRRRGAEVVRLVLVRLFGVAGLYIGCCCCCWWCGGGCCWLGVWGGQRRSGDSRRWRRLAKQRRETMGHSRLIYRLIQLSNDLIDLISYLMVAFFKSSNWDSNGLVKSSIVTLWIGSRILTCLETLTVFPVRIRISAALSWVMPTRLYPSTESNWSPACNRPSISADPPVD